LKCFGDLNPIKFSRIFISVRCQYFLINFFSFSD
jgi:hypothetical protein